MLLWIKTKIQGEKSGDLLSSRSWIKGTDIYSKVKSKVADVYLFLRSSGVEEVVSILLYLNQTPAFTCLE